MFGTVINKMAVHVEHMQVHMGRFVGTWDASRSVVEETQFLILSQAGWFEPWGIRFTLLERISRLFMFWRWWSGAHRGPPPPPPGRGGIDGGGDGDGGSNNSRGIGRQQGEQGGAQQADNQRDGQGEEQVGNQQGWQATAPPAPGQYGRNLRADGLPWQPYRRPSHPEFQPIIPLFSQTRTEAPGTDAPRLEAAKSLPYRRSTTLNVIIYTVLFVMVICNCLKIFFPEVWALYALSSSPTLTSSQTLGSRSRSAVEIGSNGGAWVDEHVMKALFAIKNEAQAVAALAAQNVVNLQACLNLVEGGDNVMTKLKEEWYENMKTNIDVKCKKAAKMGSNAADEMKGLAGRLEWILGEKWWGTKAPVERSATKTVTEGAKIMPQIMTEEGVVDTTVIPTKTATIMDAAGWQWPKRRVPAWL